MTLQKFLEKIEKTQFPICIKKVWPSPDDDKIKVNEVIYLFLKDVDVDFKISPALVSDIRSYHLKTSNIDQNSWTIYFSRGLAELNIGKPVDAIIYIPKTNPDFQAIKDKWEGWNC